MKVSWRAVIGAAAMLTACATSPRPAPATTPLGDVPQLVIGIPADAERVTRIRDAGMRSDSALADLRYLTDVIGPRLTGSAEMERAARWMAERLRAAGADSVWLETVPLEGWARGHFALRLVAPQSRVLHGAAVGWSPGTSGPVAGDVVFVDARTLADFQARFAGRLRGRWVLTRAPLPMYDVFAPSREDSAAVAAGRAALFARPSAPEEVSFLAVRDSLLVAEGVLGTISSGDKERGLLTMFGSPRAPSRAPALIVSHETFAQLHRLLAAGESARLEADIGSRFLGPVRASSVVGEWRGAARPGEIVLLAAHLDSWDLATGATDNGAGAVAVVAAARLIAGSGPRPDRTIRVALFTGEEQGLLGSTAYVEQHAGELARHQAVLVTDNGSGRIAGITLQGRDDLRMMWQRLFEPLAPLGPFSVRTGVRTGSDHLPFLRAGVPAYLMVQEFRSYDWTWHTQVDTFDHAIPGDLRQMSTVLATVTWGLARAERLIPR